MRILTLMLLVGCSAQMPAAKDEQDWTLRLAPTAELADVVSDWAERWSAATGRTILVGTEGTPIRRAEYEELKDPDSPTGFDCGQTSSTFNKRSLMWISTEWSVIDVLGSAHGCPVWGYTVGHEMAHMLSACEHTTQSPSLLETSLEQDKVYVIDEHALTLVCERSLCTTFVPE